MPFHPCYTPILDRQAREHFLRQALVADWPAPANVHATATTRDAAWVTEASPYGFNVGTRCGEDPAGVASNRVFLCAALSLPTEPGWLHQVHGTRVETFDATNDAEPEADAAVTRSSGVVLAIQTADCLPVLFCAADGTEIAAAHAGWRGLSAGVLESTLAAMRTPRDRMLAWLGPAIAQQSYEVGDEVRNAFIAHDRAAEAAFVATRSGHWLCDLYELARQRLRAAGVTQIFGAGFDTFADPRLHSFRRDGDKSGRMASLVWMMPRAGTT